VALQSLQKEIQRGLHQDAVGSIREVLVDARSRRRDWELSGRTSGNTVVNFVGRSEWLGQLVPARITAANPNSLKGEPVLAGTDLSPFSERGAGCRSK
jgi:tRNA-2-methylthio-N6-dimethylallyladenosine synthase